VDAKIITVLWFQVTVKNSVRVAKGDTVDELKHITLIFRSNT
jgi:hypothetical protein